MIDKKAVSDLMKELGIKGQNRVWEFINTGDRNQVEVDDLIVRMSEEQRAESDRVIEFNDEPIVYPVYGLPLIEQAALDDMDSIARLPYVKQAAQMPDSHRVKEGHVPVGGVVVTHDCVLPGVVGNDIACSVASNITDISLGLDWFEENHKFLMYVLKEQTYFGMQYNPNDVALDPGYVEVMEDAHNIMELLHHPESKLLLKGLLGTMRNHYGTSGDGNHFIEIGYANVTPLDRGTRGLKVLARSTSPRLAILSHFGSRGLGSSIADFYLDKANRLNPVPKGMQDNAPLFFDTDMWAEDYWMLMNLAGKFAKNGHAYIQKTHNFAWAEDYGFVHRKGATPAHSSEYANIPATMGDKSKIVIGLGNMSYLESASHGAGRKMSRGHALKQGWEDVKTYVLREHGVHLIGGGSDEDPRSYKKIESVMHYQDESVKEIGEFTPLYCRMADPRFEWKKGKKK